MVRRYSTLESEHGFVFSEQEKYYSRRPETCPENNHDVNVEEGEVRLMEHTQYPYSIHERDVVTGGELR